MQNTEEHAGSAAQKGKHEAASAGPSSGANKMHCEEIGRIIEFKTGDASLSPSAKQVLEATASWANDAPDRGVRLEGAADKTGPSSLNEELSQERAQNAKQYLTQQGVDPNKIRTEALGENPDRPLLDGLRAVEIRNCSATVAMAEPEPEPAPAPPPPVVEVNPPAPQVQVVPMPVPQTTAETDKPPSRVGVGVALGGGATGFSDQESRNLTDTGGTWEARASFGTRLPVAFEGAYVGSAQGLNALGLDRDALLVGNGAEGNLRLNLGTLRVQPYLFGGAGWTHYSVERNNNITSSITSRTDDVFTVPAGAGLSFRIGRGLLLDLRGTYRWAFGADILNASYVGTGKSAGLSNWNAAGHLGWEF